jgi:hypothetical protein
MIERVLLTLIWLYQRTLSRLFGSTCRFHPSCSHYTAACIRNLGPARGVWFGARRIARCHPWNPGGIDLPPVPRVRERASNLAVSLPSRGASLEP